MSIFLHLGIDERTLTTIGLVALLLVPAAASLRCPDIDPQLIFLVLAALVLARRTPAFGTGLLPPRTAT